MKRLDLVILMFCLQIGIIAVNLVDITPGVYITTGQVNTIYGGGITGLTSTFQDFYNITSTDSSTWMNPQPFKLCLPTIFGWGWNVCMPSIDLPGTQILNLAYLPFRIFFSAIGICFGLLFYSTILSGTFYSTLLIAIIPGGVQGGVLALMIGQAIGALQTLILIIEVVKLIAPGGGAK